MVFFPLACLISLLAISTVSECYLRPSETAIRQTKSLDGIWSFRLAPELGLNETRDEHELLKEVSQNGRT